MLFPNAWTFLWLSPTSCKLTLYLLKGKVEEATCVKADLALEATKQEEAKTKAGKDMNAALEQSQKYQEECTQATLVIEVSLLLTVT